MYLAFFHALEIYNACMFNKKKKLYTTVKKFGVGKIKHHYSSLGHYMIIHK